MWTWVGFVFLSLLLQLLEGTIKSHFSDWQYTIDSIDPREGQEAAHQKERNAQAWEGLLEVGDHMVITCLASFLCFVKSNNLRAEVSQVLKICRGGTMRPFKMCAECIPLKKKNLKSQADFLQGFWKCLWKTFHESSAFAADTYMSSINSTQPDKLQ